MSRIAQFVIVLLCGAGLADAGTFHSLQGEWRFALDARNEGLAQKWQERRLPDTIALPGTTDEARKGVPNEAREAAHLTRLYPYAGPAWYQRDIAIPAEWTRRRVALFLERTKTSRLWLDGTPLGRQDSLVAPHVYELGPLAPGRHRITLRVDNAGHAAIGDPHQISEHTQTNWNGVIGRIGLQVTDPVWLDDVQIYPDAAARRLRVRVTLGNATGRPVTGTISARPCAGMELHFTAAAHGAILEGSCELTSSVREWNELAPIVSVLRVELASGPHRDLRDQTYGLRTFQTKGTQCVLNGRAVFLRGKVDNCVFPLTGYPSMEAKEWARLFRIAKEYGINHYRFHTWCPPEAAFQAADEVGILLQPELPNWAAFGPKAHDEFLRAEGERILRAYGNHPSFVMLSLGNELGGKPEDRAPFVRHFRDLDPRHLYAQGTNNWVSKFQEGDDYWASFQVNAKHIRGSYATTDLPLGHIQTGPANTLKDYGAEIAGVPVPVVSHEIGEFQVYPDFAEIPQYTGVLRARNFELAREKLERNGMLPQAADFVQASGALAALCYREDIEAALRTRGLAGFQLLDLQDFPGQGTALVGILNAFMESKGLLSPTRWREFCSETVPLLRLPKYTFTTAETLKATAEVAHYGSADLAAAALWTLRDSSGRSIASGRLTGRAIPTGTLTRLGELRIDLKAIAAPARLTLELALENTQARNSYPIWVYPPAVATTSPRVTIRREWNDDTRSLLAAGATVLLLPAPQSLPNSIAGSFAPDFWNYGMFKGFAEQRKLPVSPGTLGLLTDPRHPALAGFPTDSHSNWQWFYLLMNSRPLILDTLPPGYRPVVQIIDNFERAHRLGVVLEARAGTGRLLICTIDLPGQQDRPEARQLLHSLLTYMESASFAPVHKLDDAALAAILR